MNRMLNGGSLTPGQYDAAETAGRQNVTNRVIEAFGPAVFNATAYPTRICDERELWRYIDVMHETRFAPTIDHVLDGLSPGEFDLFKRAVKFMVEFTTATFGRPVRCENALLRSINIYRYIKAMEPSVVLELGPGSGYVGLLLILDGIGVVGCDNTQAFYLVQNRVWEAAAGGANFSELAQSADSLRDVMSQDLRGKVVHVPWWKIVDLALDTIPGQVDVATANHCLAEMQDNARMYFLRLCRALLAKSGGPFLFEGWGDDLIQAPSGVARDFLTSGFKLYHNEERVTAFSPYREEFGPYAQLPHSVPVIRRLRNLSRRAVGMKTIPYEFHAIDFHGDNKYSNAITRAQRMHANSRKTYRDPIANFLIESYGTNVFDTEDRFLALIDRKYV
jgi:SAM-dependent methyltransferase